MSSTLGRAQTAKFFKDASGYNQMRKLWAEQVALVTSETVKGEKSRLWKELSSSQGNWETWKEYCNQPKLTATQNLLYLILSGKDFRRAFRPKNGEQVCWTFREAYSQIKKFGVASYPAYMQVHRDKAKASLLGSFESVVSEDVFGEISKVLSASFEGDPYLGT